MRVFQPVVPPPSDYVSTSAIISVETNMSVAVGMSSRIASHGRCETEVGLILTTFDESERESSRPDPTILRGATQELNA